MKLAQSRNLSFNLKKTVRTSSSSRNPLTNLMKRSRCTRDSWKNKNQFLTPTSCVSRSSSVNLKAQKPELKKLNPPLTNSDPEKECLLLPPLAVKKPPMSRKLRLLSRKPSTKSMSQEVLLAPWPFPPVHQQNSHPPPPFNPQETCALAPSMPPAPVELGLWLVQDQHTELPALGQGL